MRTNIVLTLSGHDRIGIVDQVSKIVFEHNGNVDASRMARLGSEFAVLMLISVPIDQYTALEKTVQELTTEGFVVNTCETKALDPVKYSGWLPFQVEVNGADHEGIIHHITHYLADQGINVESMDTNMVKAPMSGTPLFMMTAIVLVPPKLNIHEWQNDLINVGDELNVDIGVLPYTG